MDYLGDSHVPLNVQELPLQILINNLEDLYQPKNLDEAYYSQKVNALKQLEVICKSSNRRHFQEINFTHFLQCSLTSIYFFGMRLKLLQLSPRAVCPCKIKRQRQHFLRAEDVFQKSVSMLLPERGETVIKGTFNFFNEVSLWQYEYFVAQILEVILYYNQGKMSIFSLLLTDIHYSVFSDVKMARHRMRVMYHLLKSEHWVFDKQMLLPFVTRVLDLFSKGANKSSVYSHLRKGFEVCLRRIFERAQNRHRLTIIITMLNWFGMAKMSEDDQLEFASLLDHAAGLYQVGIYSESFGDGLINHTLRNLVGSGNTLYSLIGSRLLQRFLDRHGNIKYLVTPSIYYEFSKNELVIGVYDSSDKQFIRRHRENMHINILEACKMHCHNSVNLKSLYILICCVVLEVPCGLTAAAAACMAMSIQDFALNGENVSSTSRYWMHAVVMSVMSLICWVHKSSVLYTYVNEIIARRARDAPQLNPPLMQEYSLGHQHVTWNKPTLFFEDWELRYGLWKHFTDQYTKRTYEKKNIKAPTIIW